MRNFVALALLLPVSILPAKDWESGPGYRRKPLPVPRSGKPGFTLVPAVQTGISFSNALPESLLARHHIYQDGSGIAAGDMDGDGRCELYFCAINGRNTLYRNLGNWQFEDITERAGVGCTGLHSTGAAFADLRGNSNLDLIVNTAGNGTLVFFNDGHGHFTQAPFVLNANRAGQSLALADTDGDGFLDIFVVNYRLSALMDELNSYFTFKLVDGKQTVATYNGRSVTNADLVDRFVIGPRGDFQENGEPPVLYRNLGGSNFQAVSFTDGHFLDEDGRPLKKPPPDWGLSAMFRDINGDGLPDLYVCNDFQSPDRFWINQGQNRFRLLPRLGQRKSSLSSMSVDFADINRDGYDDFFVVDMLSRQHPLRMQVLSATYSPNYAIGYFEDRPQYELNTLFLNRGDTTFAEAAQLSGLEAAEWAWSCIFLDVDLDGWEDLLVANGVEQDGRDLDALANLKKLRATGHPSDAQLLAARSQYPRQAQGNLAFRNRHDLTFEEVSKAWGFDWKGVSSAMALADLDGDGGLDVVVNPLNGPALVYRNECSAPRLAIRLKGRAPNTRGIGARIAVSGGAVPCQTQEMICGGRYLSCDDTIRVFAAGSLTNRMTIDVRWRSGRHSLVRDVAPNFLYEVDEAGAQELPAASGPATAPAEDSSHTAPLFEDVTAMLGHVHRENAFNDFERQPLLPNKLSQLGPGLAWFDLEGDGKDDLIIGSGAGGTLGVYRNLGSNGFKSVMEQMPAGKTTRDQTGVLGWRSPLNRPVVLVGLANYEDGFPSGAAVRQYDLSRATVLDTLAADRSSPGPLAMSDLDGSGTLVLFVGGRVVPGRYPEPADSGIFRYTDGQWQQDRENSRLLDKLGLVTAAVFSDLAGNGYPALILACEWGPLRIFRNEHGRLVPWDPPLTWPNAPAGTHQAATLGELTGWWNGIAVGDFDGDGRLDLVASNWGQNTKYEAHRAQPLSLYFGDFRGDGSVHLIEAYYDPTLQKTVPERQLNPLAQSLPFLHERFATHHAFSVASVEDMLGERLSAAKNVRARCLESMVFLNRGDHFEARVLPVEAQMAPAFGIAVGDFNGDGHEDLFLAQNLFATQPETPRYDAGRGLLLLGDGTGEFRAQSGRQSGITIYGEQRSAAVCDFNGDGRLDLAVTQNGAATKLYRNLNGASGLRVRLRGPANNPGGVGAVLRLKYASGWGPAREIHAGSGYWAQDSAVQVLATPQPASAIQVRWPGGKICTNAILSGSKEIIVDFGGRIESPDHRP